MSIRLKITLPYLILTILAAIVGVYISVHSFANPTDSLFGLSARTIYPIFFAILVLSVIVIGFVVSRQIVNPMYTLVTASQAIAAGDLGQRTGIQSRDEIGELAITFDDMTGKLQERTQELEDINERLRRMDRTKSNFIQISGHELRTPLTLIMGYSQMLEHDLKKDPEVLKLVQGILEGAERMTDMVESLLDVSRIDTNALVLRKTEVEVATLIHNVQKEFTLAFKERNIRFEAVDLENLPSIDASPQMLQKVFYHLVMNAIKFTPDGGNIKVVGRVVNNADRPWLEIAIGDSGIGIDPSKHESIFEKFGQTGEVLLHSSGKTKFKGGGPGLGLAIARGIVDAHGGKIWAESPGYDEEKFPGSTFYVRLPVSIEKNEGD